MGRGAPVEAVHAAVPGSRAGKGLFDFPHICSCACPSSWQYNRMSTEQRPLTVDEKDRFCGRVLVMTGVAIVLFYFGCTSAITRDMYRPSATGTLVDIYIKPARNSDGDRVFKLMEKFSMTEQRFNCTIYNTYTTRDEAGEKRISHTDGHKHLLLHFHDRKCIKKSEWRYYEKDATTCLGCTAIPLFFLCALASNKEIWKKSLPQAAGAANLAKVVPINSELANLDDVEMGAMPQPVCTTEGQRLFQESFQAGRQELVAVATAGVRLVPATAQSTAPCCMAVTSAEPVAKLVEDV